MKSGTGLKRIVGIIPLAALCVMLHAPAAVAQVMYMTGNISGTVNGTAVDFGLHIKMDMRTGEETATVSNVDPVMGAILRQVTAMVTVAGPTGGATPQGGRNLFQLSGGNFVNSATVYWPKTKDRLELIHRVSYKSGDTMDVEATINGTAPVISLDAEVKFKDFTEIMYWGQRKDGSRVVTTGVGFNGDFSKAKFRAYYVETEPEEEGKGSTTVYVGAQPSGAVLRAAKDMTTTYDPVARTINVHLYNTLIPVEAATEVSSRGGR